MKNAFYYLLIVVGILSYWQLEVFDYVFFGKEIPNKEITNGLMPAWMQIFCIFIIIIPLLFALLSILCSECKIFRTVSLVYAGLFGILNAYHFLDQLGKGLDNFMQPVLLAVILAVNVVLFVNLLKNCKCCKKEVA